MLERLAIRVAEFVRAHLRAFGYVAFGAAVFLVSLIATFPYTATLSALLEPLNLSLTSSGQAFSLPLGAALSDVRLASTQPAAPFELESSKVTLAPAFGALLLGEPGVRVHARIYGGAVHATVYRSGAGLGLSFDLSDVGLARIAALREFGANVLGRLSGSGWARLEGNDPTAARARIDFRAADLTIRVARGFVPVRLGDVTGALRLARGELEVTRLNSHGPDGRLHGHGTIHLGPDPAQGRIDMRLVIDPSPAGRKRLGVLFGLLPHPPGPRQPYVVTGPLFAPSIS
jgi:type II secretion system protein N